jgi:hypothetical protein
VDAVARGNNSGCTYQLHTLCVIDAWAGTQRIRIAETGHICCVAHQKIAVSSHAGQNNDMAAGGLPGVGNDIAERKIIEAGFRAGDNHRIAQGKPCAQYVRIGARSLEVQPDLHDQVIELLQRHTIRIADGIIAIVLSVPLLGLGDHLRRALRGHLPHRSHRLHNGASEEAAGKLGFRRLKLIDIAKRGNFASG